MFKIRSVFFKLPQNKSFDYQPRYYDPVKEELDQRVKMAKVEAENYRITENPEAFEASKIRIAQSFKQSKLESKTFQNKSIQQSRFRFMLILVGLLYLCYWILG